MRKSYLIRPLQHGLATESPALHINYGYASSMSNWRTFEGAIQQRWGYGAADRATAQVIDNISLYQLADGSRYSIYLGATDAMKKETAGSNTFSFITDTYATGTIASMDVSKVVVTGNAGTNWLTSGVAAGDKFIINADHSSAIENDVNWATVLTVDNDTQITLAAAYTGATTSGAYKLRKVYTIPANTRWSTALVNETFIFTNGNVDVQKYTGSGYATALDSTNAKSARYCIEYANRLVLADLLVSGVRDPWMIQWSKEGDPTNWTDSTAGSLALLQTEDILTGLGRVGASLVAYKQDSVAFGESSGVSTTPIFFPTIKRGVGCIAPWSITEVLGTNVWLWRDNFYLMSGQDPVPIGGPIRNRFFDIVDKTEVERTWAAHNALTHEVMWFANTSEGQIAFTWNYMDKEWYEPRFAAEITGFGKGAL